MTPRGKVSKLFKTGIMAVLTTGILLVILQATYESTAAQEGRTYAVPTGVSEYAVKWLEGTITDDEFWSVLRSMLIAAGDDMHASENKHGHAPVTEPIRAWISDRTMWWTEGRMTDEQFLDAVRNLEKAGHLKTDEHALVDDKMVRVVNDTTSLVLEDILPTEREIDAITRITKWRFVHTEYDSDNTAGIGIVEDSVHILMRDINRVYDPIFNKYKVATMSMQAIRLANAADIDSYWIEYTNQIKQDILDSAHMSAVAPHNTECIFNYSDNGALTVCVRDNIVMQVVIFDMYAEHYLYSAPNIELDSTEPTTSIMDVIIRKLNVATGKDPYVMGALSHILQKAPDADVAITDAGRSPMQQLQQHPTLPPVSTATNSTHKNAKNTIDNATDMSQDHMHAHLRVQEQETMTANPEKAPVYGVTNLACTRDDFGVMTITGRYNNDGTARKHVEIAVSFVDWDGNIMARTTAISFSNMDEFETRRFLGHVAWNENFAFCMVAPLAR